MLTMDLWGKRSMGYEVIADVWQGQTVRYKDR
jgi:hypothetical protein